jgi:1-acyl-sn-glycerol-3-phosphate acyltransferase
LSEAPFSTIATPRPESSRHLGAHPYDHGRYRFRRRILQWMIRKIAFGLLIKVDGVAGLDNFPTNGPAIIMINHIAFVDPIVVMGCLPRQIVPMAKIEAYHYPMIGIFPRLWDAIPVHRGEFDRSALRKALRVLRAGEVILVAPEGTRGPALGSGKEGIAYLAALSRAPIIPVAIEGTEGFPRLYPFGWKGPGAFIRIGQPFRYRIGTEHADRALLRTMTDEAMYYLAALLPEKRRGVYCDLGRATSTTLELRPPDSLPDAGPDVS